MTPQLKVHLVLAYIKFLFRSTNQHGVHSPFVYNLLTQCFYKKEENPAFKTILAYISTLKQDPRQIKIKDFGAGSRIFKSDSRKISDIAQNAGISRKRAVLLNKLTSWLGIKTALELGTSLGISSTAIAAGNSVKLITLEGCPETAAIARQYFKRFSLDNIDLKVGSFEEILPKFQASQNTLNNLRPDSNHKSNSFDLIYFDGNHQKAPTLRYFDLLLPAAHNDTVFIFDDIHWSKGMEEAWNEIKSHPQVRVTIDCFYWGIVFFRQEQEKEHFTIRL